MKKIFATAIISALSILPTFAAAQTTPTTDNSALIAVLEQLVQFLTQELNLLLAKQAPAMTTSSTTNQTFITPSGAVIGANGTVLNTPTAPTTAQTTVSATNNNATLSISAGQSSVTTNSAYLSWNTTIPANSKVFLTQTPVAPYSNSTQVIPSVAGYSTQGFVNISNLNPSTQYSYMIEAINGTQDQKLNGVFSTNAPPAPTGDPQIVTDMQASILAAAKSFVTSTTCPNTPIIVVRPETRYIYQPLTPVMTPFVNGDTLHGVFLLHLLME